MNILGDITPVIKAAPPQLQAVDSARGGWWPLVREPFTGAWQRNQEWRASDVLTYAAVYACVTLIANDIGKLRLKLIHETSADVWEETQNPAYSPVLRKPNHYQNRIEFFKTWMFSRLLHGNTYVLKERDQRGVVIGFYILEPTRVKVLVAPNGEVFYELNVDPLSLITTPGVVPASEIIHDKHDAIYHPLVGLSPISACYLAALQAIAIQENSNNLFANGSTPSGILTAPTSITEETAKLLQQRWYENYSGENAGRIAVMGNDLKFESIRMTAVDAQLIEQLKWTAENVCTAFHVPPYKIGVGPYPPYNNIEALNTEYYSQALQSPIESIELAIDHGLDLAAKTGVEFDLDQLLRMDTQTRMTVAGLAVSSSNFSINESRKRFFGLKPITGGDTIFMQQQNWPVRDLAKRPMPSEQPPPAAPAPLSGEPDEPVDVEESAGDWLTKAFDDLDALEQATA